MNMIPVPIIFALVGIVVFYIISNHNLRTKCRKQMEEIDQQNKIARERESWVNEKIRPEGKGIILVDFRGGHKNA